MSKNIKWSADDMKKKGLVSNAKGDFVKVSSLVNHGKVDKIEPFGEFMANQGLPPKGSKFIPSKEMFPNSAELRKYPLTPDECVPTNLFGEPMTANDHMKLFKEHGIVLNTHVPPLDTTSGEYILWVRTLTGKARDNAVMALKQATEEMFKNADEDCFFIKGNTASSKNGKEIGRFKKRNGNGVLEDFTTLVDSNVTKAYRKSTHGQWLQNKVAFKNATQGLKIPLNIEFTFIRDSLRRFDLVNASQVVCDLMVEYGWIVDDESCYLKPSFGNVYYHKQLAGVLIKILKP